MALNTDTNFPPSGPAPYRIHRDWCMGDSLYYINLNSSNFDSRIETVSSLFLAVSSYAVSLSARSTPTINLNFNSRNNILSAEVVNSSINTVKLGGDILQAGKALLSSASLSALQDVSITSLASNQALVWNGTKWINQTVATGSSTLTDGDYTDIYVDNNGTRLRLKGTDVNAAFAGSEAVRTANIRDGAVTPAKLSTGRPYWSSTGLVGINNVSPNARLTINPNFGGNLASKLFTTNIGTFATTTNTVSTIASFGLTTSVNPNGIYLNIKSKRNTNTPDSYITTALGLGLDHDDTTGPSQIWLTEPSAGVGRVGINTSTPNHTLTIAGNVSATGTIFGTTTNSTNTTNLTGGTSQSVVYQSSTGNTAFLAAGTSGQLLQTNGTGSAPSWVSPTSLTVGTATNSTSATNSINATKLAGGTAQSVVYQSSTGNTAFLAAGDIGQLLKANGTGSAPAWVSPTSLSVGYSNNSGACAGTATNAIKLLGGAEQSIVYQSSTDYTAFLAAGTPGYLLQTNGTGSAPSWTATPNISTLNCGALNQSVTFKNFSSGTSETAGKIYGVNTTSGPVTVILPSGTTGACVRIFDSHRKWNVNNCSISSSSSQRIEGGTGNDTLICDVAGAMVTLIYVDSSRGWSVFFNG